MLIHFVFTIKVIIAPIIFIKLNLLYDPSGFRKEHIHSKYSKNNLNNKHLVIYCVLNNICLYLIINSNSDFVNCSKIVC